MAAVVVAEVKGTETAEVAEGDATAGVESVVANAVIAGRLCCELGHLREHQYVVPVSLYDLHLLMHVPHRVTFAAF